MVAASSPEGGKNQSTKREKKQRGKDYGEQHKRSIIKLVQGIWWFSV
jgi:hypothetical protein